MNPDLTDLLGGGDLFATTRTKARGPEGEIPITPDMLLREPSGRLFGMTQDAGMGWNPADVGRPRYLIVSTQGGLRDADGTPIALGYHTGHWEIGLLVRAAAETLGEEGVLPYAAYCSDPCDGRSQGTAGMFDSLPYRNDAAITMRRLIRSLPGRAGVMAIATCDKGLPAAMLALAGCRDLPGILVPGGVTLPAVDAEDLGKVQSIGARFAHGLITLEEAAAMGCRACGSPGGGCQFLGTAATSQVVAEALGLALPHSALAPSGETVWLDAARRSARALLRLSSRHLAIDTILTRDALENAMLVHAAFGGSTNLLLHVPALAHAAGLPIPTVEDWDRVNRAAPRLVDALPNGPLNHPTVQVFLAGGVPEVMLHLRRMGLLKVDARTVTGETVGDVLDWWESSDRRRETRARLQQADGVDPERVIMGPDAARRAGLARTVVFPTGNIAPQGSVVKATAIDPSVVGDDDVYRHRGPARVFTSEADAIVAIKGQASPNGAVKPGDVIVLAGAGPLGTGMEETYQLTSALKYLPWGKSVAIVTDARFSGVSTGACIGHVGPEALAGGPIGKLADGDVIEIEIDRRQGIGRIDLVGVADRDLASDEAERLLAERAPHPGLRAHPHLPADTRLWAALQNASGGAWAGCVYDVDRIVAALDAGLDRLAGRAAPALVPPAIDVDGVRLRALRPDDAAAWHAYLSDPLVTELTSYPDMSLAEVRSMIERCLDGYAAGTSCTWAVTTDGDDRLVGTCGFNTLSRRLGCAELAYDLTRSHWGRGVITRAVAGCLDWAFAQRELNRVHAFVMVGNARSDRVLEKSGFTREGRLRAFRTCRGEARDYSVFSILRPEWERHARV